MRFKAYDWRSIFYRNNIPIKSRKEDIDIRRARISRDGLFFTLKCGETVLDLAYAGRIFKSTN